MSHLPDCLYCRKDQRLTDLMIEVAPLQVSTLYLFKEQTYRGRCIVAYNGHVNELYELPESELNRFSQDVARAARAMKSAYKEHLRVDKIVFPNEKHEVCCNLSQLPKLTQRLIVVVHSRSEQTIETKVGPGVTETLKSDPFVVTPEVPATKKTKAIPASGVRPHGWVVRVYQNDQLLATTSSGQGYDALIAKASNH
jgi:hypothetical protein